MRSKTYRAMAVLAVASLTLVARGADAGPIRYGHAAHASAARSAWTGATTTLGPSLNVTINATGNSSVISGNSGTVTVNQTSGPVAVSVGWGRGSGAPQGAGGTGGSLVNVRSGGGGLVNVGGTGGGLVNVGTSGTGVATGAGAGGSLVNVGSGGGGVLNVGGSGGGLVNVGTTTGGGLINIGTGGASSSSQRAVLQLGGLTGGVGG